MSDNLKLEATGIDRQLLVSLLDLCANQNITGLRQMGNVLHLITEWDQSKGKTLSFKPALMADTITEWLGRSKGSNSSYAAPDYGPKPDIDGDCKKGWRLVAGSSIDVIEIHPCWMMYGK